MNVLSAGQRLLKDARKDRARPFPDEPYTENKVSAAAMVLGSQPARNPVTTIHMFKISHHATPHSCLQYFQPNANKYVRKNTTLLRSTKI
jgi:hypothetical protein